MPKKSQLDNRCQHIYADGRRCRMRRIKGDPSLCPQHRRQHLRNEADPGAVAAELLDSIEDFETAPAVNLALGRLFVMLAGNRIPPRNAAVLAYIGQLLLNSVAILQKDFAYGKAVELLCHMLVSQRSPKPSGSAVQEEDAQNKAPKTVARIVRVGGGHPADTSPKDPAPPQTDKSRTGS